MRARQLEMTLDHNSTRGPADLFSRMRELRNSRMLPVGGRGINAPEIDAEDAATILIASAGSLKATEAPDAVRRFAPLVEHGTAAEITLGEALTSILGNPELARLVDSVRFNLSHTTAEIMFDGGRVRYFFPAGVDVRGKPEAYGKSGLSDHCVIGGGLVHQVANELAEDDETPAVWGKPPTLPRQE